MKAVAEKADVSTTTVSHVINKTRFVSPEKKERVLEAIKELDYQPNGLARSFRKKRTKTLGLIIPDNTNPYFAEVARGVEDACFERGYSVILCNSDRKMEKEINYLELLMEKGVDGIAFVSVGDDKKATDIFGKKRVPKVLLDRDIPGMQIDSVLVDNRLGGFLATDYLIKLGHRRIACITGPSKLSSSLERELGYNDAFKKANITLDKMLIQSGSFHSDSGYEGIKKLLSQTNPPTAIFACNDLIAIGAMYGAIEMGFKVPEDLSIIGFDDISLASFMTPRLTTVMQPKYEIGKTAANLLIDRIKNRDLPIQMELFKPVLTIRDSCSSLRNKE
ncbi:MAG: LacI family DNA-binding transcriptional regulator [Spirochaetia bacterium]|jgi:LacI family transcriptional regulator|nr:LacI family DNA-binding transcriptional regulator [Spirochaetia bacterium]